MTTPAEDRAEFEGLMVIPVTAFELIRIAEGNPMIMRAFDGTEVLLRLPTPDEAVDLQRRAAESLGVRSPAPDSAAVRRLAEPLSITRCQ